MAYLNNQKPIDAMQIYVAVITSFLAIKKYEDSLNFINEIMNDTMDNFNLEGLVDMSYATEATENALKEVDLLEDELNFIAQVMTKEILVNKNYQIICFNKLYDYDDTDYLIEQVFRDIEYYHIDFEEPYESFKKCFDRTYSNII